MTGSNSTFANLAGLSVVAEFSIKISEVSNASFTSTLVPVVPVNCCTILYVSLPKTKSSVLILIEVTSKLPSDGLDANAYDNNFSTYSYFYQSGRQIKVSEEMQEKENNKIGVKNV